VLLVIHEIQKIENWGEIVKKLWERKKIKKSYSLYFAWNKFSGSSRRYEREFNGAVSTH
jgi:hypothetical protein